MRCIRCMQGLLLCLTWHGNSAAAPVPCAPAGRCDAPVLGSTHVLLPRRLHCTDHKPNRFALPHPAGLVANVLVESLSLGPVSPFDAAATVLTIGGIYIAFTWTENYGDSSNTESTTDGFKKAAQLIWNGGWVGALGG